MLLQLMPLGFHGIKQISGDIIPKMRGSMGWDIIPTFEFVNKLSNCSNAEKRGRKRQRAGRESSVRKELAWTYSASCIGPSGKVRRLKQAKQTEAKR